MTALTFDTLKFANRLKAAGVSPGHAEAEAEALSEVFEANTSALATKQDLREYESAIRADLQLLDTKISSMEERFNDKLEKLEMRMTIKLGSIMVLGVGLMVTLSKLIH